MVLKLLYFDNNHKYITHDWISEPGSKQRTVRSTLYTPSKFPLFNIISPSLRRLCYVLVVKACALSIYFF